jgi:FMN-dependent NADH-azoreductase
VITPLRYIGIDTVDCVAIEYDEFADERLHASIADAEVAVDALVERLADEMEAQREAA